MYAAAFDAYFSTLSALETRLTDGRPFLTGDKFTECGLRLFPTLYHHGSVYYLLTKRNGARNLDYPHLWHWLSRVHAMQGVPESNSLDHCLQGYFGRSWNYNVPLGPFSPMTYLKAYTQPDLAKMP